MRGKICLFVRIEGFICGSPRLFLDFTLESRSCLKDSFSIIIADFNRIYFPMLEQFLVSDVYSLPPNQKVKWQAYPFAVRV